MVLEVTTRWIANGRVRLLPFLAIRSLQPKTPSFDIFENKIPLTGFLLEIPYDSSQHHRPYSCFLLHPHPHPRLSQPLRLWYEERRTLGHYPHRGA